MLSRSLLTLAAQGYQFPQPGALKLDRRHRAAEYPTIRVRVLRPFYALRRRLEAGEVVALAEPDAIDAIALGRAKRA